MSTSSTNLARSLAKLNPSEVGPAWKQELNERLAATRARGARKRAEQAVLPGLDNLDNAETRADSRAARLAAKVAERYANAPAYSEVLAARARAAAFEEASRKEAMRAVTIPSIASSAAYPAAHSSDAPAETFTGSAVASDPSQTSHPGAEREPLEAAAAALSSQVSPPAEEIFEEVTVSPALALPANLIEFPRELVAARKARPRLAEGPLREAPEEDALDQSQLRIFEVHPESISPGKTGTAGTISKSANLYVPATEWSSIRLDSHAASALAPEEQLSSLDLPLQPAPLEDRFMAGIFDVALVLLAFVLFVLVFAACTAHPPSGKPAWVAAGLLLAGLLLLYQYLFFKYAEGTPGMRYAKIALCTFDDENPTREAMRRRLLALLFSAAPLGLGLAWAWFDADRLGWHDRITRMYQRSYR